MPAIRMITASAALLVALLLAANPAAAQEPAGSDQPHISVSGAAAETAANDIAFFSFGMEGRGSTATMALAVASKRARRVIAALRAADIASGDIRTRSISVGRYQRRRPRTKERIVAYRATNRLNVTVRDLARAGAIVDAAVRAGATEVSGPAFGRSDSKMLYQQALVTAFEEARRKAEALAASAGVKLGRPLSITERSSEPRPPAPLAQVGDGGSLGRQRLLRLPLRPGRSRISARVAVVFAIE